jgi:hypothetical protein
MFLLRCCRIQFVRIRLTVLIRVVIRLDRIVGMVLFELAFKSTSTGSRIGLRIFVRCWFGSFFLI